jgi:hypothetical protein
MTPSDFEIVIGAVVALITAVGGMAFLQERKAPKESTPSVLTNTEVGKLVVALNGTSESVIASTKANYAIVRAIEDTRDEMRDLRHELRMSANR